MKTIVRRINWIVALLFLLLLLMQGWYFGWVVWWKYFNPHETSFMELRLDELQEKNPAATLKHVWVPYAKISPRLKQAAVASEDDKFVEHDGFDWEGMQKALEKNRRKGKVVAGGSTISQQLAKNLLNESQNQALAELHNNEIITTKLFISLKKELNAE